MFGKTSAMLFLIRAKRQHIANICKKKLCTPEKIAHADSFVTDAIRAANVRDDLSVRLFCLVV